jgi:hypothetical protein
MFHDFEITHQKPVPFNQTRTEVNPESSIKFQAVVLIQEWIHLIVNKGKIIPQYYKMLNNEL